MSLFLLVQAIACNYSVSCLAVLIFDQVLIVNTPKLIFARMRFCIFGQLVLTVHHTSSISAFRRSSYALSYSERLRLEDDWSWKVPVVEGEKARAHFSYKFSVCQAAFRGYVYTITLENCGWVLESHDRNSRIVCSICDPIVFVGQLTGTRTLSFVLYLSSREASQRKEMSEVPRVRSVALMTDSIGVIYAHSKESLLAIMRPHRRPSQTIQDQGSPMAVKYY